MTHYSPVYRTKDNKMERVTNNRSLEAERYGRAHSSVRHRRSMMNVGGRTHGGRRRNEQRAVDSIDVNACSCSLHHVLSNVPLHSRLVFFFFYPFISPFFFPARRLFLLLIFFPVLIMDGLVALLTRDIEARRINTAVSIPTSSSFLIFTPPPPRSRNHTRSSPSLVNFYQNYYNYYRWGGLSRVCPIHNGLGEWFLQMV